MRARICVVRRKNDAAPAWFRVKWTSFKLGIDGDRMSNRPGLRALFGTFSAFDTSLSLAEKIGRLIFYIFVGASGTATALVARVDPVLRELGAIYWIAVGLLASLLIVFVFWLLKSAFKQQALGAYYNRLAVPKGLINPLDETFKDVVISVDDLRLPNSQWVKSKHFKRCIFVGPAVLGVVGGSIRNNKFENCGDAIAVPKGTVVPGVVLLHDCTIEDCEFLLVTLIADPLTGSILAKNGYPVVGLAVT